MFTPIVCALFKQGSLHIEGTGYRFQGKILRLLADATDAVTDATSLLVVCLGMEEEIDIFGDGKKEWFPYPKNRWAFRLVEGSYSIFSSGLIIRSRLPKEEVKLSLPSDSQVNLMDKMSQHH